MTLTEKLAEEIVESTPPERPHSVYRGFAAGVASGVAKCLTGHPFDTVKVRLQTTASSQFAGPLDCLLKTVRNEGFSGLYKGVTPPLFGWMMMDSVMLGSMTNYRKLLQNTESPIVTRRPRNTSSSSTDEAPKLNRFGMGIAGMLGGWTVSFIAAPIEHIKARLQVQYHGHTAASQNIPRLYTGPIDCTSKIFQAHGIRGLYRGLFATMLFRTSFFFFWICYDISTGWFQRHTSMSTPAINFWAGGLSAQVFWLTSYPSDIIKQKLLTDELEPSKRRYKSWWDAARSIYVTNGWRGYFRGFVPCVLRATPSNGAAILAFEAVMRTL